MAEPLVVSPTSAPWLESCLHRYHTLQVLRAYPGVRTTSPVLRFSTLVHACLRDLYDPRRPGDLPHVENLDMILHFAFVRAGYSNDQDRLYDLERARVLIRTYLKQADILDDLATVGVEVAGTWPVKVGGEELYTITARLDRVLRFPDGLVAGIDYKIGATLPPTSGILINLAALKAANPGGRAYEFWIESLGDEAVERTVYRGEDFKGAIRGLTAQVQRYLSASDYPAEPSESCVWCPLRPTCERGGGAEAIDAEDLEF